MQRCTFSGSGEWPYNVTTITTALAMKVSVSQNSECCAILPPFRSGNNPLVIETSVQGRQIRKVHEGTKLSEAQMRKEIADETASIMRHVDKLMERTRSSTSRTLRAP